MGRQRARCPHQGAIIRHRCTGEYASSDRCNADPTAEVSSLYVVKWTYFVTVENGEAQ